MEQTNCPGTPSKIKTQLDAVIHFLCKMDVEMVADLLDDNLTYQEVSKKIFIEKLSGTMDELSDAGNHFLKPYPGECISADCNEGCRGISFIGNKSKDYMDLIIDEKDGVIKDIYECRHFRTDEKGLAKKGRKRIKTLWHPYDRE